MFIVRIDEVSVLQNNAELYICFAMLYVYCQFLYLKLTDMNYSHSQKVSLLQNDLEHYICFTIKDVRFIYI